MRRCQLARVSTATVGRRALGGGRERPNFRVRDFVCVLARRAYDADARNVDAHDGDAVAPSHHAPFRPPPPPPYGFLVAVASPHSGRPDGEPRWRSARIIFAFLRFWSRADE